MTKRILAGLAGLALTGGLFGLATTAQADGCNTTGPTAAPTQATLPGTGSQVYATPPGGTSGTIGVKGSTGYIEASGSATSQSGYIQGSAYGTPVNGRIAGSATSGPTVCLADGAAGA